MSGKGRGGGGGGGGRPPGAPRWGGGAGEDAGGGGPPPPPASWTLEYARNSDAEVALDLGEFFGGTLDLRAREPLAG
jgi:hypothetical protein